MTSKVDYTENPSLYAKLDGLTVSRYEQYLPDSQPAQFYMQMYEGSSFLWGAHSSASPYNNFTGMIYGYIFSAHEDFVLDEDELPIQWILSSCG
jgi:hypothetical protein